MACKTLIVLGPEGTGKNTIIGCLLFKLGGINMMMMQWLDQERIPYDRAVNSLKSLKIPLHFSTLKHPVDILGPPGVNASRADCAILVLETDTLASAEIGKEISSAFSQAKELIIVINKMDVANVTEEHFQKITDSFDDTNERHIPIIPVSALYGENVVVKSPSYEGRTLLDALNVKFDSVR